MTIQNYVLYSKNAYTGQEAYASENRTIVSGKLEDAELDFGLAVKNGVKPRSVVKGSVAGNVFGISVRELNHEAKFRPSQGATVYKKTMTVSVMRQGSINVELKGTTAVAAGDIMHIDETTGEFQGSGGTTCLNVTALEAGVVGDIIKVRIDIVHA